MIRIKTVKQIATSQMIRGMRSLHALGRSHHRPLDDGRIHTARTRVESSEMHRQWRNQLWNTRTTRTK